MSRLAVALICCACSSPEASPAVGASCGLNTSFPGDEACLLPPADGLQLHYGPGDYTDAGADGFVLPPGGESLRYERVAALHPSVLVAGYDVSGRPGLHHLAFYTGVTGNMDASEALVNPALFLAQTQREVVTMRPAGAALAVPIGSFVIAAHAFNNTELPILVEAWVNLHLVASAATPLGPIQLAGGQAMAVPPHTKQTVRASWVATEAASVVQLAGHIHAHTTEERASVAGTPIYRTTTWEEPDVAWFDPPLPITRGQTLSWECDVNNTTDAILRYANQVQTAEMCNLVGFKVGLGISASSP